MQPSGVYREDKKSYVDTRDAEHCNVSLRTAIKPARRIPYRFDHVLVCLTQIGEIRFTTDQPGVGTTHRGGDILLLPAAYPLYTDYVASSVRNPLACITLELDRVLIDDAISRLDVTWPDNESLKDFYCVDDVSEFVRAEAGAAIKRLHRLLTDNEPLLGRERLIASATEALTVLLMQSNARQAFLSERELSTSRLDQLKHFINDHLSENLSVTRLARLCHMSSSSLHDHVRRSFGTTPAAMVRDLRIARAKRLLKIRPCKSLKEIALETGFRSGAHFSQTFKVATGVNPTQYRGRSGN